MGHENNFENIVCVRLCITISLKMNMILIKFFSLIMALDFN
jgi:hypothetical protein